MLFILFVLDCPGEVANYFPCANGNGCVHRAFLTCQYGQACWDGSDQENCCKFADNLGRKGTDMSRGGKWPTHFSYKELKAAYIYFPRSEKQ